ncbi:MAG: hypothetical protein HRU17_12555 [Polyangiaceae bacterium]|nr:hypothetical protein [Polyangiaceae bacterium]
MMKLVYSLGAVVAAGSVSLIPIGGEAHAVTDESADSVDMSALSPAKPSRELRLLFIHHSVGGQLFSNPGERKDVADSIHLSHENGGGLRQSLEEFGYEVHEASYGSRIGQDTDLFDWLPKFRNDMALILSTDENDRPYGDARKNDIVMFKSCYPNNKFTSEGDGPGDPAGPELTLVNAQASLLALLAETRKHPDRLFVYLTAPPNAGKFDSEPLVKWLAKKLLRKPSTAEVHAKRARLARQFNNWVKSPTGWLKGYELKNVAVFDYYDILTNHGETDLSAFPSGDGADSHPNREGQQRAAADIGPFVNRAVRRSGLSE